MTTNAEHLNGEAALVIGATLVRVEEGPQDGERKDLGYDEGELLMIFELPSGREVEVGVWADEEGNGNGWLCFPSAIGHAVATVEG